MSIVPYSQEPTRKNGENSKRRKKSTATESNKSDILENTILRLSVNVNAWCKCGTCVEMSREIECVCCKEVRELVEIKWREGMDCITQHESFSALCLNKDVLWTALVSLHDRECAWLPENSTVVSNRSYRYASYRQFCWFTFEKLGRYVRRVIPSCVTKRIREEFPEIDGNYVGFIGYGNEQTDVSETEKAWEYIGEHDSNEF